MLRYALSFEALDKLCIVLIFSALLYELPATVIAEISGAFSLFDLGNFYSYRVRFAAFVIAVAIFNLLVNHRYIFKDPFFLLYVFFLAYMMLIVWINRETYGLLAATDTESASAMEFYNPILFKFSLFFLVGFYLPRLINYRHILLFILVFSLGLIMVFVDFETMGLDTANYVDKTYLGHYLFLGDATSMAALISIAFFQSNKSKIIFTLLCCVVIFFIGSRTSFAVFAATIFLYFIISFKPKLLFASAIAVFAAGFALSSVDLTELESRNPRMFGVLFDYESDNSVIGREQLEEYGWDDISESILMGNFGGQLTSGFSAISTWRNYMHNVFSYWRQFGILALIIILVFTFRFYAMLWKHREKRNQSFFALSFLIGVFICVEATFSRSFAFPYAHIFLGLAVATSYTMTADQKSLKLAVQYYQNRKRSATLSEHSSGKNRKRRRRTRQKSMRF